MATSETTPRTDSEQCPECGNQARPDGTERVCSDCGLVVDEHAIDHGPEWRAYDASDQSRVRAAPTNPDRQGKGLGSEIGTRSERKRDSEMRRRSILHGRAKTKTKRERNRRYVIGEIQRMGSALDLDQTITTQSIRLFRSLHEEQAVNGRDLDELAATAIYTTCRINQRGLTPRDIEQVARASGKRIAREHKWLCSELGLESPPPCPRQRIRVVAAECGASRTTTESALERLDDIGDSAVYRGSPSTLAAALLWTESEGLLTQEEVSRAAGCTPAALRGRLESVE